MGIGLPAIEPDTSSEDRPPSRVEYLDYRAVARHEWSLEDDDLFGKAAVASIPEERYGSLEVSRDEPILVAATDKGLAWPSSCRGGSCAACTATPESDEPKEAFNTVTSPYLRETVLNR